ncbi:MAG: deoxyribose-phosphate aldolase [Oscillospiraceae bacterium]|jgi:deoxyribose-phosphate aldolase
MEIAEILKRCDHTLLRQNATIEEIQQLCDEGIRYGVASVCIAPAHVGGTKRYVGDRLRIGTVVGFPNGYSTSAVKAYEAADAIRRGADEIDMVVNLGMVKDGCYQAILEEIREVKAACSDRILKVIIETCLLTEEEKIKLCHVVGESGADFIKTSTGFSTGGATPEDVQLMRTNSPATLQIKAAGGIASLQDAETLIACGADRLGSSRLVKLAQIAQDESSALRGNDAAEEV